MTVPTLITDLSTTAASNSPAGSDNVFPDLDNFIRAYGAFIAQLHSLKAPIASPTFTGDAVFSTGSIGIGVSPTSKLHVSGTGTVANLVSTSGEVYVKLTGPSATGGYIGYGVGSSETMTFLVNGSEKVRIDSSGNIGVGATSPNRPITINNTNSQIQFVNATTGTAATDGLLVGMGGAASADAYINQLESANLIFNTAGTERLRIDSSGNVTIASGNVSATSGKFTAGTAASASNDLVRFGQMLGGYNQAWSDVTASRAVSSTYTNSSGHPIEVLVSVVSTGTSAIGLTPTVGGVQLPQTVAQSGNAGYAATVSFVVPNGATYSIACANAVLGKWCELS